MTSRQKALRDHFDKVAPGYDFTLPAHVVAHYLAKRVAFIMGVAGSGPFLDVGCGSGKMVQALSRSGCNVFGIDNSLAMLRCGVGVAAGRQVQADAGLLPFKSGHFGMVVCIATLHHIANPGEVKAAIDEMFRVVRPGGHLLIWDHNPLNPYWKLLMRRVPQDCGDERLIPRAEIIDALKQHAYGIMTINLKGLGFVPDFVPPALIKAAARLERFLESLGVLAFAAAHNVVLVTKRLS